MRLSAFDTWPYEPTPGDGESAGIGRPAAATNQQYRFAFGCCTTDPSVPDPSEPIELIRMLSERGVRLLNLTCGSPYYNPHIQRPAIFPPSDGYLPPEDPLVGVARQIHLAAEIKRECPGVFFVGSGYTYLQDYVAQVAQATVGQNMVDAVGLGRMVLSYPELPADTLGGKSLERKLVCRTFSDCTTAPRKGLVSGCYPLDSFYKQRPEREVLLQLKKDS